MKILVDEMPIQVEDCPYSNPTDMPWNDRTIWFCSWGLSHSETCPMAKGCECPYFTTISRQNDLECIIDAFNAIPNSYPVRTQEAREIIIRNPNRKD